jgi:RNA polymerase sigma-70 factor (ECF subfamily)
VHVKLDREQTAPGLSEVPETLEAVRPTLEALYRDYVQFVWRTVKRLGVEPAQLDDAVQEVFIVVHRQLGHYEPRTTPRAWLFSIARRVASNQRRARRRKVDVLPLHDPAAPASQDGPLRAAMNKERSDVVLEFLGTLPDELRDTFILCELEQMSAPEIALALSVTTSAVYARIRTARLAFADFGRKHYPELMGGPNG